jgi:REP element-mobilizing transposase RayT
MALAMEAGMARRIRYFAPDSVVEVTCRVMQGRFLLRPSSRLNEIVVGVLGRALERYEIKVFLIWVMSNHIHLILRIPDTETLSRFMCFFEGNLAKKVGRLHDWRERFWGGRFHAAPILDEEALVDQVEYVLSQGCKEGLVDKPRQWPGVNSVRAVVRGAPLRGIWFDWTKEDRARRRGVTVDSRSHATEYEVSLEPLPFLADKSVEQQRSWFRGIIRRIERKTRRQHRKNRSRAAGVDHVRRQSPHQRADDPEKNAAPVCHATDVEVRDRFLEELQAVREMYMRASRRWRSGDRDARFPDHCFSPPAVFGRALAPRAPP